MPGLSRPGLFAWVTLLFTLLFGAVRPASADPGYPIPYPWEDTIDQAKAEKLLHAYIGYVKEHPADYMGRQVLAQICFANWRLEKKDNRRRLEFAKTMLKDAQEMTKLAPGKASGYHWMGAALGMAALTRGVLNSLQLVPEIKKNFEKSIELDATYLSGSALVQMARVYTMLPSFPISIGDREKAVKYLLRAKEISPSFTLSYLYLADLYWSLGKPGEALAELDLIAKQKPHTEVEYFLNVVNEDKAKELRKLITSGAKRDPFFDVLSDIQPGLVD